MTPDTFPRQYARTRRLSLGEPRSVTIAANESRLLFLRSRGGSDPVTCLWAIDVDCVGGGGVSEIQLLADPLTIDATGEHELPAAERARRERMREQADGITAYAIDSTGEQAVFALSGRLYIVSTAPGATPPRALVAAEGAFDPRLSPNAESVAYIAHGQLRITPAAGSAQERLLAGEENTDDVTWGVADFIASEELNRFRGFWWSPDSTTLAVARVDNSPVDQWWIADPANPDRPPVAHRYPAAGTANADVSLWLVRAEDGHRTQVGWDAELFPYVVAVSWTDHALVMVVMDRAQRRQQTMTVDLDGTTATVVDEVDDAWVELVPGTPVLLGTPHLVSAIDTNDTHTLAIQETPLGSLTSVTPANLQVRRMVDADHRRVVLTVSASGPVADLAIPVDPAYTSVLWWPLDDHAPIVVAGGVEDPGMHDATAVGDTMVVRSASVHRLRADHRILRIVDGQVHELGTIPNLCETALVEPRPVFLRAGPHRLPVAVLLPSTPVPEGHMLPVLMDPYGGPHAQRVVASRNAFATSQWLADQGFVVVVVDGRGTPGLGPVFERQVLGDLATPVLEDQIISLHCAAEEFPQMDLTRVAIRGWSFGGYLAALAVLRRPDVFHAAVVGAPVTDWRLYDTAYTERYLGDPTVQPDVYEQSSLLADAPNLTRPMMLIHGLADDNVVSAHTLRLSSALLAAGRPHEVLPLTGVTHMTPQEVVAENLLLLQVDFLRRSLKL